MKSTVEVLEDNKVKVSVEVDETEFEQEVDAAFKRISKEVPPSGVPAGQGAPAHPRGEARLRRRSRRGAA